MKHLMMLANYNTWVNTEIFKLCAELSDEDYRKDRSVFFGSIHATLNHLLLVDMIWLGRMKGQPVESIHSLDQTLFDDFESLSNVRNDIDKQLIDYVSSLDEDNLEKSFSYTRMTGASGESNTHESLLTLFNHQTHHRGQVHAMLTQAGVDKHAMPDIDIVDYLASTSA